MKAVIPAAGLGTRFLPATKNSPKEMLPIVDTPTIQYVVEEAVASGCDEVLIITGRGKRAIEDHFDRSPQLELTLYERGDDERARLVRHVADMAEITYKRQKEALGLGHAILQAQRFVQDEPFAVLLGDDIVHGPHPATRQLVEAHGRVDGSVVAVEHVPDTHVHRYGIVDVDAPVGDGLSTLHDLVEKPTLAEAPSNLGIIGRYFLAPEVFDHLETTGPDARGEIQLTDALRRLNRSSGVWAQQVAGRRYDTGDKLGWLQTNIELALQRPDLRDDLARYLRDELPALLETPVTVPAN